ncbi:MAG: SpoIIIAH-like family protein [Clostridia bacterium]|nr:SpoIIIAH-like family protein [Clostridia bacterium]
MMVFKRKQIVVLSLVLMIVVAGYLQYSYNRSSTTVSGKESERLGEAVYVEDEGLAEKGESEASTQKSGKSVSASKQANDFFTQAKMDKDITRSKDIESMKQITKDTNASKDVKSKAYEKMMKMVESSQKEMKIEMLVKEKGFDDAVALFGDDGSIDIIIKSPNLTSAQTAQIADIAARQANVEFEKIHVKNIF